MPRIYLSLLCIPLLASLTACAPSVTSSHTQIMPTARVMEVLSYRTKPSVSEHKHIAHASAFGSILDQFDGFVGRNLAHNDDGLWIDVTYWRDETAAEKARDLIQSMDREELREFFGDMQGKDGKFSRAEIMLR